VSVDLGVKTAAFQVPDLVEGSALLEFLRLAWGAWLEHRADGTFVVVLAPERPTGLDALLGAVEEWLQCRAFLALPFHVDGGAFVMGRDGSIAPSPRSPLD